MKTETMLPAMRLIGWCKNISQRCAAKFPDIFRASLLRALVKNCFVRAYTQTYGWRLTEAGYRWLALHGYPMQPDQHMQRAKRRFDHAAVVTTMYAAGIDPFVASVQTYCEQGGYLPTFPLRSQTGQHTLGSNLVMGFLRVGDTLLATHYPRPESRVILQRDYECTQSMMLRTGCTDMGYLFCGNSYADIYRALVGTGEKGKQNTYTGLFRESRAAYLLPCDPNGAMQLQLMCLPDLRTSIASILGKHTEEMTERGLPDCDAIDTHSGLPLRIMVDMELRRVPYAARQASAAGYQGLLLVGLESQRAFLEQFFPPPFFVVVVIPDNILVLPKGDDSHAPSI